MSLSTSSSSSNTSTSAAPASTKEPEVCVCAQSSSIQNERWMLIWMTKRLQEKPKAKASSDDAGLALNISLQQAKDRAHQKRSNKKAPQMDWSKRNELFSNLWASPLPFICFSWLPLPLYNPLFSLSVHLHTIRNSFTCKPVLFCLWFLNLLIDQLLSWFTSVWLI